MSKRGRDDTRSMKRTVSARIPTAEGKFSLFHYRNQRDDKEHLALVMGEVTGQDDILVRVHSECFTGDVLGSRRCDCGEQLRLAMEHIANEKRGVLLYLRQEGRGIGLEEKLKAYNLQDQGYDTVEANLLLGHQADERQYWAAAGMLSDLGVCSIRLLTNNPDKVEKLSSEGIRISGSVRLIPPVHEDNFGYLTTKVEKMRHLLSLPELDIQELAIEKIELEKIELEKIETQSASIPPAQRLTPPIPAIAHQNGTSVQVINNPGTNRESYQFYLHGSATNDSGAPAQASDVAASEQSSSLEKKLSDLAEQIAQHRGKHPFVTLTWAQSLDGSIASKTGEPLRLSAEGSMRMTHRLRAMHDAILVGIGTVLADNPKLTTRLVEGSSPRPVIVDSSLRTPLHAAIFQHPKPPIFATLNPKQESIQAIRSHGGEVLQLPSAVSGGVDLPALLNQLMAIGIRSVMVEGGAQILNSFLQQQLGNRVVITIAPRLVGGIRVLGMSFDANTRSNNFVQTGYTKIDTDMIFWGAFE